MLRHARLLDAITEDFSIGERDITASTTRLLRYAMSAEASAAKK